MYSLEKQRAVPEGNPNRVCIKANKRKEALQKLVEYLRNERNYSEKEIKKLIAKSFVEKVDC